MSSVADNMSSSSIAVPAIFITVGVIFLIGIVFIIIWSTASKTPPVQMPFPKEPDNSKETLPYPKETVEDSEKSTLKETEAGGLNNVDSKDQKDKDGIDENAMSERKRLWTKQHDTCWNGANDFQFIWCMERAGFKANEFEKYKVSDDNEPIKAADMGNNVQPTTLNQLRWKAHHNACWKGNEDWRYLLCMAAGGFRPNEYA